MPRAQGRARAAELKKARKDFFSILLGHWEIEHGPSRGWSSGSRDPVWLRAVTECARATGVLSRTTRAGARWKIFFSQWGKAIFVTLPHRLYQFDACPIAIAVTDFDAIHHDIL